MASAPPLSQPAREGADAAAVEEDGYELEEKDWSRFKLARVFKQFRKRVNSLDFHRREAALAVAGDCGTLLLINTSSGEATAFAKCQKYGVDCVTLTHHSLGVLMASKPPQPSVLPGTGIGIGGDGQDDVQRHAIRYASLYHQQYVRFFNGHTGKVTHLSLCPANDSFLSSSVDQTVRMWDLRSPRCSAIFTTRARAIAQFDAQGLIFGVVVEGESLGDYRPRVKLFSLANYNEAFSTLICPVKSVVPSSLKFSPDGKGIILACTDGGIVHMDSFESSSKISTMGVTPQSDTMLEASFSPCSRFVVSGSADRNLHVFEARTGKELAALAGHASIPSVCKFSPTHHLIASGCNALGLWQLQVGLT